MISFFMQVNISAQNVGNVIGSVSGLVSSANQASDQNSDSLRVVTNVLTESAGLIQSGNVSLEVVDSVSNKMVLLNDKIMMRTIFSIIKGYKRCCGYT